MVEMQELFKKVGGDYQKDNSYTFVRVNEILVKFYYKIEKLDKGLSDTQNCLSKSK